MEGQLKSRSVRKKIETVAIANRGEVAVRIIRACQELGLKTVLLHSEPDEKSWAARLADSAVCIGPAAVAESYLSIKANIQHALAAGADAIHPGFGFLSENANFAREVEAHGMAFVGPIADSIELFGDKISAKKLVEAAGGPTIPGYKGEDQNLERLLQEIEKIGLPVIVKAAAGGGGRGLKVVRKMSEAREMIASAQREGLQAFGSDKVFLEKYLDRAKHIEVQVFGDVTGRVVALGERECSVQRRHQKIIEEAPAALLPGTLRDQILACAVAIAEQARYENAGTVEFLVQDNKFYFMEMNTRLQVEHPVTELVMGVDLVKSQLLTAMGQKVYLHEARPRGHAIECRIYAEDPWQGGIPSTGEIVGLHWPHGAHRRFEVGFEEGDSITSHYDSMMAKVVVWDETRTRAIQKMRQTLAETVIFGVKTNIPLLQEILKHPEFVLGDMTTAFFAQHFSGGLRAADYSLTEKSIIRDLKSRLADSSQNFSSDLAGQNKSPWTHNWGE